MVSVTVGERVPYDYKSGPAYFCLWRAGDPCNTPSLGLRVNFECQVMHAENKKNHSTIGSTPLGIEPNMP